MVLCDAERGDDDVRRLADGDSPSAQFAIAARSVPRTPLSEQVAQLHEAGVEAQGVAELDGGRFVTFDDPDGNTWTLQQLPARE